MPVKTNGFMDWTRLFRGLEARVGALLLMGALVFACALAHADSRRIVITQDRDDNINVSVDPSLMPDANIRRESGRMVIELPDKAFPRGFEPGTLRVDSDSRQFVRVERTNNATTVVIDSSQIFLSIQDLSAPPRRTAPAPAVPTDVAREMAETKPSGPVASPEIPEPAQVPVTQPKVKLQKPEPVAAKSEKMTEAKPETEPEVKPAQPVPEKSAQSELKQVSKPEATMDEAPPLTPETLDEALSSMTVEEEPAEEVPEPLAAPVLTHEGETGIPLDHLMRQRRDPVTSDGTLIRIVAGLLVVLLMIGGFFRYMLPALMRRYPDFFKNRQEAYERKMAARTANAEQAGKGKKAREPLLGLAGLRKRELLPVEEAETVVNLENAEEEIEEEEVYPLFRQAGIFPALGVQEPDLLEVDEGLGTDEPEPVSPKLRTPEFRLPTLPKITLPEMPRISVPRISLPALPRLSMPAMPQIRLPEFRLPDYTPVQLKAASVWRTIRKRMEPDPERYMKQIKDMNGAFDVLYTRNLSRTKALHLVDLWGRHMIIATTSKTVTLLGVMRGEGRDLYFEDLTVDNVRLMGEYARGQSPTSYILDFYEEARSGIVQQANRTADAAEEADFDDLYRKYLREQEVRREQNRQVPEKPKPEKPEADAPKISADVTDWNRPVFPRKTVKTVERQQSVPASAPQPLDFLPEPDDESLRQTREELSWEVERPVVQTPVETPREKEIRREEIRHREILQEVVQVIRPRSVDDVVAENRRKKDAGPDMAADSPELRQEPVMPARKKTPRRHPAQMEEVVYLQDYDDEY